MPSDVIPVRPGGVDAKERWKKAAEQAGVSLNAFVVEAVEARLGGPAAQTKPRPAGKGARRGPRSEMCSHRRRPDQFCSRCDT